MFIDEYGRRWNFKAAHDTSMMLQISPKMLWAAIQLRDISSGLSMSDTEYRPQYHEDRDCYICRMPDGSWCVGVRHSDEPADCLFPYLDDRLIAYMIAKHRNLASHQEWRAIVAIDIAYPPPELNSEVWAVIGRRRDGGLPDPIKSMYAPGKQWVHHDKQSAVEAMGAINGLLGGDFAGVFRCLLRVISYEPPTKE